jgi:glycosyltransferase involved in cell wall biosynthesis
MRQLHVVTASQRRGAEVFARDLCEVLAKEGDDVTLAALTEGPQGNALDAEILGTRPLGFATLRALRRTARDTDVVVAHGSTTLPASVLALAGTKVPLVYRNIGDPLAWSGSGFRRVRTAALLRRTRHLIAVWPGAAKTLHEVHGIPEERITVVPNGVDASGYAPASEPRRIEARATLGLPAGAPIVVQVGALSPEKDVETAIRAIGQVDDAHLLVVGDGPQRDELEACAAEVAPGRVHFAGALPGAHDAFAAADVVLLTSRTEGMPGVLVEAGLCGLPAVASDVGGVAEIVLDGVTGVLTRPNDVAGVAQAITQVLANPADLGAAARDHCLAHFEMGVIAQQWRDVLEGIGG